MKARVLILSILFISNNIMAAPVCSPGSGGMTYTEGSDGVRVVYPSSGWTYTEGRDGRRVVYPTSGWTYTEGSNGRRVVYPTSGCQDLCSIYKLRLPNLGSSEVELVLSQMGPTPCSGN